MSGDVESDATATPMRDALSEAANDALRQVWCVVYDSETPSMDGTHPPCRMADQSYEQAVRILEVIRQRSARAPKRNLRIETRFVTGYSRVTPPATTEADS